MWSLHRARPLLRGLPAPHRPCAPPQHPRALSLFDRLIPPDDAPTAASKAAEAAILSARLSRSKYAEVFAAPREKLFEAGESLLPAEDTVPFPPLKAVALGGGAPGVGVTLPFPPTGPRATLVTVSFQALGQAQAHEWAQGWLASGLPVGAGGDGSAPAALVNVVHLQGWFMAMVAGVVRRGTAQGVPPPLLPYSAIAFTTSEAEFDRWTAALRVHNRAMAHVALVDAAGQVRWRAHSAPTPGELLALAAAGRALLEEQR